MKRPLFAFGLLVLSGACTAPPSAEEIGAAQSAIINGRPSGDDENAAVYIETKGDGDALLRCSGRIIAPGLVLTARHCILKRKGDSVRCTADGSPVDITDTIDAETEPVERITVFVGSNKASLRPIAVKQAFTDFAVTLCKADIAYLVLAEPGLDTRTPLRRAPPTVGETISVTGWGYVDDGREKLPDTRSTVETRIAMVGPGLIPPGTFSVRGNTLCLGDSGANALIDGAVVGIYTRIDGDPNVCTSDLGRNVLTEVISEADLAVQAYAAIGEEPWFAGEEKPWLAAAGAGCAKDDDCRGGVCERAMCRAGCGPTKLACKIGQDCVAEACVTTAPPPPPPSPAPADDSSCAAGPRRGHARDGWFPALAALAILVARRRRPISRAT